MNTETDAAIEHLPFPRSAELAQNHPANSADLMNTMTDPAPEPK